MFFVSATTWKLNWYPKNYTFDEVLNKTNETNENKMVSVKLIKIVDGVQMDCKGGGQGQFCKVSPATAANSKM